MKSLIKSFLVIIIVCFSFNSYGQFKFDLKKSVDAVQNGIKGTKGKTDQNKPVQKDGKSSSTDTTKTGNNKDNQNSDQKQPGL